MCRLASVPVGLATTHGVGVARVALVADTVLVTHDEAILAVVARSVDVAGGVTVLAVAALVDLVRVRVRVRLGLGFLVRIALWYNEPELRIDLLLLRWLHVLRSMRSQLACLSAAPTSRAIRSERRCAVHTGLLRGGAVVSDSRACKR